MAGRPIPLFDLAGQHEPIAGEIEAAIARVLASQQFVRGPEIAAVEREVAALCGAPHAVACASGSDALLLSLMAHGIGPGDRVVCPALTFFSTAAAIARLGAVPVFADVDPGSYCVDPAAVREAIDRAGPPAAVMAVHLFGRAADVSGLAALTDALGVPLVEDVAQSIGARDAEGRPVGTVGHDGCLSFYPTKNLGGLGDGGMLLVRDADRAERLRRLRDHGEGPDGVHHEVGINSRLDALQAAVIRAKLPHLEAWTGARQAHAALYRDGLGAAGAGVGAGGFDGLELPVRLPEVPDRPASHVFHHFVVRVPAAHRDRLAERLSAAGIGVGVYYRRPLHRQPCFVGPGAPPPALPRTEAAARECLALPVHPALGKEQVARVCDAVVAYFAAS